MENSTHTIIDPTQIRNKWVKVDGVPMSMYQENTQMTERVYWGFKREYSLGLVNIGTPCNTKCFYCSQYWNPPDVIIAYPQWLTMDEIKHFLTFVPKRDDGVTIIHDLGYGHHISNGEFFSHPQATEILKFFIKERCIIRGLDSNGHFINEEQVKLLKILLSQHSGRGVKVNEDDSLPETHPEEGFWWGIYLHLTNYEKTKHTFELLDKYKIPYAVVIVISLNDLKNGKSEEWIRLLNENHNPVEIEISHPGYTKYAPPNVVKHLDFTWDDGWEYIRKWRKKFPRIDINSENRISPDRIDKSLNVLMYKYQNNPKVLFLISKAVEKVFENHVKKITHYDDYRIKVVKNNTFGGNIIVAGLLLVQDYIPAIEQVLSEGYIPDLIVLPKDSFYFDELDLTGVSAYTIKDKFGIEILWC
tara:strand:+ start:842 stop:2089 length:1248 start_codon:yes stop_codon:yes gene_type:complete